MRKCKSNTVNQYRLSEMVLLYESKDIYHNYSLQRFYCGLYYDIKLKAYVIVTAGALQRVKGYSGTSFRSKIRFRKH